MLLVERDRTGGDCRGPGASLQGAAGRSRRCRDRPSAGRLGVLVDDVCVDFPRVMDHVHGAIGKIAPVDSPEALEAAG